MKKQLLILITVLILPVTTFSADRNESLVLELAETLLNSRPDSSRALLLQIDTNSLSRKAKNTWQLLDIWTRYNQYDTSILAQDLERVTSYFLGRRDRKRRAQAYYLRAAVGEDIHWGSPAERADDYLRGCKEADRCREPQIGALLYQRYGVEMSNRQWYESAISSYKKSLDYAVQAGMVSHQVSDMINLSHCYMFLADDTRDYTEAISWSQKACDLSKRSSRMLDYARALQSLSSCYSRAERFDEALKYAQQSVTTLEEASIAGKYKERVRYSTLADAWRKVGNADSCLFYAFKDYDHPSIITRRSATQLIYIAYRDLLHDDANALKYMSEYNELTNHHRTLQESDKVAQNQVSLETEIAQRKRSNIMLTVFVAFLFTVLAFVVVVRLYRYKLRVKENDLRNAAMDLSVVTAQADAASQEADRVTAVLIDEDPFVERLRRNPKYLSDADWERLIEKTDRVYDGFCAGLSQADSSLTQTNIRLCCLLKLRFTNPQIGLMMGISPSSVVKAKQRLKGRVNW